MRHRSCETTACRPDGAVCLRNGSYEPQGVCRYGTATCTSSGAYGACEGYVGPSAETCGNGLDDDCDGQVDEDCTTSGGGGGGGGGYGGGGYGGGGGGGFFYPDCNDAGLWGALSEAYGWEAALATYYHYCGEPPAL